MVVKASVPIKRGQHLYNTLHFKFMVERLKLIVLFLSLLFFLLVMLFIGPLGIRLAVFARCTTQKYNKSKADCHVQCQVWMCFVVVELRPPYVLPMGLELVWRS